MRTVGKVEMSDEAFRAGCMVCPQCGDTKFGSRTAADGGLIRTCHGAVNDEEPCTFQWPASDDHLYFYVSLQYVLAKTDRL